MKTTDRFEALQIPHLFAVAGGSWFAGRRYVNALGFTCFVLVDGRILDYGEIAEGELRAYAPARLYATKSIAQSIATRANNRRAALSAQVSS